MPPKGRPPKKKRNISGLKNQPSRSNAPLESITESNPPDAVKQYLEACPTEVIRRFINRSWRFMSAYHLGLTGYAAAWAVRKQRQQRQVSQRAMMSIDAVLTTSDTN